MLRCVDGPCHGRLVSEELGDRWPAATVSNYGSVRQENGSYGHLLGWYEWSDENGDPAYVWRGAE